MKLFSLHQKKEVLTLVKNGCEYEDGVVVGTKGNAWLLDTDSGIFRLEGKGIRNKMILLTIAYLKKVPNLKGCLLLEDSCGEMLEVLRPQLIHAGYSILELDLTKAYHIKSLYSALIHKPTAIFVDSRHFNYLMRDLLLYIISKCENGKCKVPLLAFVSQETAFFGQRYIAMAQKRNIKFVVDMRGSDWKSEIPLFADISIKGVLEDDAQTIIYKRGFPPIANDMDILI